MLQMLVKFLYQLSCPFHDFVSGQHFTAANITYMRTWLARTSFLRVYLKYWCPDDRFGLWVC
jgi:hypothetical protein